MLPLGGVISSDGYYTFQKAKGLGLGLPGLSRRYSISGGLLRGPWTGVGVDASSN